jgi:hypothetical protein
MRLAKKLFGFLVAIGILGLGLGMVLPTSWNVARTVTINAEPQRIHRLVDDLSQWPRWTGWTDGADKSFAFDRSYVGSGVGSSLAWRSAYGTGKLTLIRADSDDGVAFDLALNSANVNAHGAIAYTYDRETHSTNVTWSEGGAFEGRPIAGYRAVLEGLTRGPRLNASLRHLKDAVEQ